MNKVALYRDIAYPLLSRFTSANRAHERAVDLAAWAQDKPLWAKLGTVRGGVPTDERLRVRVGGVELPNPLILPAGFDKDARAALTLHRLGFGSVIVGTVLTHPQHGNPHPTIFRPAPGVVLNRMGFPSEGVRRVVERLPVIAGKGFPLGISVGINKDVKPDDAPVAYAEVVSVTLPYADYFEINVSSPNTPGLRDLQNRDHLEAIIGAIHEVMGDDSRPLWVKISPDLTRHAVDDVMEVALEHGIAAIAATNTTANPLVKAQFGGRWADVAGGVSGPPLRERSTEMVAHIVKQAGDQLDVVGVGGVTDFESMLEKLQAGAKAVGIYTGFVTHGPALPSHLLHQLLAWMKREGVGSVGEIGKRH